MTKFHVVLGSGFVGRNLARLLANSDKNVILVSRSGKALDQINVSSVKGDASSLENLMSITTKPEVVYNCVNPTHYHKWESEWPPIARAINEYVIKTESVLVTCSNLYGYGPVETVITEDLPLNANWTNGRVRAEMWQEVKELHDAKKLRATEVRASDYICASDQSRMGDRVVPNLLKGKKIQLLGAIDQPHTWTDPEDVANLMMVIGQDERAWGKPWHVPSNEPKTQLEVVEEIARALGVAKPKVSSIPLAMQKLIGLFNPVVKELINSNYQFEKPFIMSDQKTRNTFGISPKKWEKVIQDLIAPYLK
ncbi:MAG: NAD-dependent epimerase/dehydratase family protein [Actinomycetes bacterium]